MCPSIFTPYSEYLFERGSSVVECRTRNQVSPASNPPLCYRLEDWAYSFSPRRPNSLSCINEHLAVDSGGNVSEQASRITAAWLNASPDTALYKNIPFFTNRLQQSHYYSLTHHVIAISRPRFRLLPHAVQ